MPTGRERVVGQFHEHLRLWEDLVVESGSKPESWYTRKLSLRRRVVAVGVWTVGLALALKADEIAVRAGGVVLIGIGGAILLHGMLRDSN